MAPSAEKLREMHPGGDNTLFARVKTSQLRLAYEVFGDPKGQPVLMMEGVGADMTVFPVEELIEPLVASGCYVIRMDHRDNGQSDNIDEQVSVIGVALKQKLKCLTGGYLCKNRIPYTLEDMAVDAVELLDELGVEKAHFVGHSMGGMIAQLMAITYPQRVLSLTTVGSCPGPGAGPYSGGLMDMKRINDEEFTQWKPDEATFDDIVKAKTAYYKAQSGTMWSEEWHLRANAERVRRMVKGYGSYLKGSDRHCCAVVCAGSRQDALKNLRSRTTAPVLVISGQLDPIVPKENGVLMAELVRDAKLLVIEGMGHLIVPEACPQILESFRAHCLQQAPQ
eukprot:TRINITY_DN121518_c0_g1_i1.p1 TRINITY_DN121518_c0_g1~~TRINITY_DN121518_c0_g1_i1.p1  ORF type:complete len:337 (-),score=84.42 TRINITY_DN121518_c0_g1_i1:309-1319(-)